MLVEKKSASYEVWMKKTFLRRSKHSRNAPHGAKRPESPATTQRPANKSAPAVQPEPRPAHSGNTLIWGFHAVREAWLNPRRKCHRLWASKSGWDSLASAAAQAQDALLKRPSPKICDARELDRLAPEGSVHQGLLLETAPLPDVGLHEILQREPPASLVLILDQVTDPHNVGAVLRSAAALGAEAVIMTERHAPSETGVLAKSASGALEHVPQVHVVNIARALDTLREEGFWIVGLAEEGEQALQNVNLKGKTALALGAEGSGLRHLTRQKCDMLAKLPTQGPIGSLNVSNAAAIALYETRRQQSALQKK